MIRATSVPAQHGASSYLVHSWGKASHSFPDISHKQLRANRMSDGLPTDIIDEVVSDVSQGK